MNLTIAEGLVVRPGDRLVIAFDQALSRDTADEIHEACKEQLPGVRVTIISGAQITVQRQEGGTDG